MSDAWPDLPFEPWRPTCDTLHMWTQIVGKVRLALAPHVNHWWQVALYLSARGLTTGAIPYRDTAFEMEFDFIDHVLAIRVSDGRSRTIQLAPRPVADFHAEFMSVLRELGLSVHIWTMPQEFAHPIPFDKDTAHAAYDRASVERFLARAAFGRCGPEGVPRRLHRQGKPGPSLLGQLRSVRHPLLGPPRPADAAGRQGHAGSLLARGQQRRLVAGRRRHPPCGLLRLRIARARRLRRGGGAASRAFYDRTASQFRLKYDDVRVAQEPRRAILDFCQSTYEAAATLGRWNRTELER
jgi:hypothetical protein